MNMWFCQGKNIKMNIMST